MPQNDFVGSVDSSVLQLDAFEFTPQELNYKYSLKSSRAPDA